MMKVIVQEFIRNEKWPESVEKLSTGSFYNLITSKKIEQEKKVLCFGSINLALLNRANKCCPGFICNFEKLRCVNYYPKYQKYLINQNYAFTSIKNLYEHKEQYLNIFGSNDCVFVRPDTGYKTFTGQVIAREKFVIESIEDLSDCGLIVVSEPVNFQSEYRLFVFDKKVITGSRYMLDEQIDCEIMTESKNADIFHFANSVIENVDYEPDIGYAMDIGVTYRGRIGLIELNGFSCSGFYDSDVGLVINKVGDFYENML